MHALAFVTLIVGILAFGISFAAVADGASKALQTWSGFLQLLALGLTIALAATVLLA